MAGNHHVEYDPAILKWAEMNNNRPKHFRFNNRTGKITVFYTCVIPAMLLGLAYWSEGRYEMRGKRRGDVIKEF